MSLEVSLVHDRERKTEFARTRGIVLQLAATDFDADLLHEAATRRRQDAATFVEAAVSKAIRESTR